MEFRHLDAVKGNGKLDAWRVDWRAIEPDPANDLRDLTTKENREHIEELKNSIEREGVREPLRVRTDEKQNILATDGRCRLTALAELRAEKREHPKTVLVLPEPRGTDEKERNIGIVAAGIFRKNLDRFEIAKGLKRQIAFGWTEKQIAEYLGWKSPNTVKQHLDLLALSESIKQQIRAGNVSGTTARNLAKSDLTPEQQAQIIEANLAENKRIKGNKNRSTKVTAKTIKRDKEKVKSDSKPEELEGTQGQPDTGASPVMASGDGREPFQRPTNSETTVADLDLGRFARPDDSQPDDLPSGLPATQKNQHQDETLAALINLTKQAHLCVQHNSSEDHPGWWSIALVEAIRNARDVIERLTGSPMEFEALADSSSQEVEAA